MKKLLAVLLSLTLVGAMLLSLASCGEPSDEPSPSPSDAAQTSPTPDASPKTSPKVSPKPSPSPTPDPYADYTKLYDKIDKATVKGDKGMDKEGVENIFDQDSKTKWCVKPTSADGSISCEWAMTEPVTLAGYGFTTANDSADRNPQAWTLYGSASADGTWTELSVVTEGNLPKKFQVSSDIFVIEKPAEYQYYKLVITDNFNKHELYQFSELTLLGAKG